MNKNLVFDVIESLQMGGYSDDMVLYRFKNQFVSTAFGAEWHTDTEDDLCLDGRFIAIYCNSQREMQELLKWFLLELEGFYESELRIIKLFKTFGKEKILLLDIE